MRLFPLDIRKLCLTLCSSIFIIISALLILLLLIKTIQFFLIVPFDEFALSLKWNPLSENKSSFSFYPLIFGTVIIALIALFIAAPIGVCSAIFLSEFCSNKIKSTLRSIIEIAAGIPTVIYGYFAVIIIAPFIKNFAHTMNIESSLENALTAGIAMGIMIIPFICSLTCQVFDDTPNYLKESSKALGASKHQTVIEIILPANKFHIISVILLALSRAIGETMIVTMAAGVTPRITFNIFESVTTITTQIVILLSGDQEFNSPATLAAFALATSLFIFTLLINYIADLIKRRAVI